MNIHINIEKHQKDAIGYNPLSPPYFWGSDVMFWIEKTHQAARLGS
jgi:hypothetical protein